MTKFHASRNHLVEPRALTFAEPRGTRPPPGRSKRAVQARKQPRKLRIDHKTLDALPDKDATFTAMLDYPVIGGMWEQVTSGAIAEGIEWKPPEGFEAHPGAQAAADSLNAHDEYVPISDTVEVCLQATLRGYATIERSLHPEPIRQGDLAGLWRYDAIRFLPQSIVEVKEDEFGRLCELKDKVSGHIYSEKENADRWWQFMPLTWGRARAGDNLGGHGQLVGVYQFWEFALHLIRWWESMAERLGTPPVLATFSEAMNISDWEDTADDVLESLNDLVTNFIAALPPGYNVQFPQTGARNAGDFYKMTIDFLNNMMKLNLVLQIASGGEDVAAGSLARTQALQGEKMALIAKIHRWLTPTLRQLYRPLVVFNFGRDVPVPVPEFKLADPGAEQREEARVEKAINLGILDPDDPEAREVYQLQPLDDERAGLIAQVKNVKKVHGIEAPPPAPGGGGAPTFSEGVSVADQQVNAASERLRVAATRKVGRWLESGKDIDLTRPLPLIDQFSDAYVTLGLPRRKADEEAARTARAFTAELASVWPQVQTLADRQAALHHVAGRYAAHDRLSGILDERG